MYISFLYNFDSMSYEFSYKIIKKNNTHVLMVSGDLDVYTIDKLQLALNDISNSGNAFSIDLNNVQFIDSSGLGVIARCAKNVSSTGEKLTVQCNQPQVCRLFDLSNLTDNHINLVRNNDNNK